MRRALSGLAGSFSNLSSSARSSLSVTDARCAQWLRLHSGRAQASSVSGQGNDARGKTSALAQLKWDLSSSWASCKAHAGRAAGGSLRSAHLPVAIRATMIAAPITSPGRFSPRGPLGMAGWPFTGDELRERARSLFLDVPPVFRAKCVELPSIDLEKSFDVPLVNFRVGAAQVDVHKLIIAPRRANRDLCQRRPISN